MKYILTFLFCLIATVSYSASLIGSGIVASSASAKVDDDFATDSSDDYTVLTNQITYDSTNHWMKGATENWNDAGAYHETTMGGANHYVQAKISWETSGTSGSGLLFRNDGSTETGFIVIPTGTGTLELWTYPDNYVTGWSFSGSKSWAAGTYYLTKAEVNGTTLKVYVDWNDDGDFDDTDETVTSGYTVNSTPTGNYIGAFWHQNGAYVHIDDLEADAL